MQQNHQNAPQQSAGLENQGSNPNNSVQGSNPNNSVHSQRRNEQNFLSSTMIEPDRNPDGDSEDDSDDPDMEGIFEDEQGERDYKACMIHWRAKYKERARHKDSAIAKTSHKINYGRVHPPTLHLEQELGSCTFEIWKNIGRISMTNRNV